MKHVKRCPFCGSLADVEIVGCVGSNWMVRCLERSCLSEGPVKNSEAKAVKFWNKRVK